MWFPDSKEKAKDLLKALSVKSGHVCLFSSFFVLNVEELQIALFLTIGDCYEICNVNFFNELR